MPAEAPFALSIPTEALTPLIAAVVEQTLARLESARSAVGERIAFSEPEAAPLIGLNPHQLRDQRRRGKIAASAIVGKRVRYMREDLVNYLLARRTSASE